MTAAEYHAFNRAAKEKHTFAAGNVTRKAGANYRHCDLKANVLFELTRLLRGKKSRCKVCGSDLKICAAFDVFLYGDVLVLSATPAVDQDDALRNPLAIVEILSPTTSD